MSIAKIVIGMKRYLLTIVQILIAITINAQTYKYTSANLNLRSGPSTADKVLATIPSGASVEMKQNCICEWIQVSYEGNTGYVSAKYLTNQRVVRETTNTTVSKTKSANSAIKYYTNSAGQKVQSPTYYKSAPAGASALCRDGTYSFSKNRRGTCSHHGGVAKWLK